MIDYLQKKFRNVNKDIESDEIVLKNEGNRIKIQKGSSIEQSNILETIVWLIYSLLFLFRSTYVDYKILYAYIVWRRKIAKFP
jgi:hypothetical protein